MGSLNARAASPCSVIYVAYRVGNPNMLLCCYHHASGNRKVDTSRHFGNFLWAECAQRFPSQLAVHTHHIFSASPCHLVTSRMASSSTYTSVSGDCEYWFTQCSSQPCQWNKHGTFDSDQVSAQENLETFAEGWYSSCRRILFPSYQLQL